jgi:sporulation protein YlmC with PRC-barrel domain
LVEITRLFWKKVFTSDAVLLGEIHSAELDMDTWQVTNFYLNLSDEAAKKLGFRQPYLGRLTICLPVSEIKTIKDTAILNKTMEELGNLRQCKE